MLQSDIYCMLVFLYLHVEIILLYWQYGNFY